MKENQQTYTHFKLKLFGLKHYWPNVWTIDIRPNKIDSAVKKSMTKFLKSTQVSFSIRNNLHQFKTRDYHKHVDNSERNSARYTFKFY